jgi:hypothetical protein
VAVPLDPDHTTNRAAPQHFLAVAAGSPAGYLADAPLGEAGRGLGSDLGEMNSAIRITAATAPKRMTARPKRRALPSGPGFWVGSVKG